MDSKRESERWEEVLELTRKIWAYCTWKDERISRYYSRLFVFSSKGVCDVCYEVVKKTITQTGHVRKNPKSIRVVFGEVPWNYVDWVMPEGSPLIGVGPGVTAEEAMANIVERKRRRRRVDETY